MGPRLDLADWIAPLTVTEFCRSVLGRRPLVTPARPVLAARLRAALGVHRAQDAFGKQVRQVSAWFIDLEGNSHTAAMPADSARLLYEAGTTAYFQDIAEFAAFEREAAETFRVGEGTAKVRLLCDRPSAATKVHFDRVDTLTVQLTGRRTWRIAPNDFAPYPLVDWSSGDPVDPALRSYQQSPPPTAIPGPPREVVLEPGAVLHLPRGYWHETYSAEDSISLHLELVPPLRMDFLLAGLKNELARDERWRQPVYDFETPAEAVSRATVDLAALRAALDRLDPRDLVRGPVAEEPVEPGTQFVRAGQAALGVDQLDRDTALISVSAYGFRGAETTGLRVRRECLPALRWVADMPVGAPVDVPDVLREAPELSKAEARDVLALLEKSRLLRRA